MNMADFKRIFQVSQATDNNHARFVDPPTFALKEMLSSMVSKEVNKIDKTSVLIYVAEGLLLERQKTQADVAAMIAKAIKKEHDNLHAERHKTFEHGTYSLGESSFGQGMDQDQDPPGSCTQEQLDEFDAWMDGFGSNDDEVPDDKVSQELLKEMSGELDEAKLQKDVDEMLRQRCNSGDEHHIMLIRCKTISRVTLFG
nr:hypothetical protein [Tanacetum cinerariifolium]